MENERFITLNPFYTETVSADEFLELYQTERDNIESAYPLPSPLGSRTLGRIAVQRKKPVYKQTLDDFDNK